MREPHDDVDRVEDEEPGEIRHDETPDTFEESFACGYGTGTPEHVTRDEDQKRHLEGICEADQRVECAGVESDGDRAPIHKSCRVQNRVAENDEHDRETPQCVDGCITLHGHVPLCRASPSCLATTPFLLRCGKRPPCRDAARTPGVFASVPSPTTPLVSILTPSCNQAAWLGDNLHSVACQTYPHIEHIVMDGGSTDGSVGILESVAGSVRWHSEPDDGQADAVNKAFAASSGEIIGWLNSDDAYFDSQVVEDVVAIFVREPDVDVVYGHAVQTTEDGAFIQVLWVPEFDADLLGALDFIVQPAAFVRSSALSDPMLDESFHFAMDYELWLRLRGAGATFRRINRVTAIDRHQPSRKSSTIKDIYRDDLDRLATMHLMHLAAEWDARRSAFYRRQRLGGALLIPSLRSRGFAFQAPADPFAGLLRRQVGSRRSGWPEAYR